MIFLAIQLVPHNAQLYFRLTDTIKLLFHSYFVENISEIEYSLNKHYSLEILFTVMNGSRNQARS